MPASDQRFMHMLRYLPGILLVQVVTAVLLWVNQSSTPDELIVQFGIPAAFISVVTGFWFASIARADSERLNAKLRVQHAQEREKLSVNAEKTKARILEKSHKEIRKQEKRIGRKAGFKVTLAFVAASAAGVLMLIIELFTFGLMTIMTTAGGLGGYLIRARQTYDANKSPEPDSALIIDAQEPLAELPPPPKTAPGERT